MSPVATQNDLRWVWLASEVLLVATSVSAVLMLQRVFGDTTFYSPLLFTVFVSHALLISMRWLGFAAFTCSFASLAGTILAIVAVHYSSTAVGSILPTTETLDQVRLDMSQAQEIFQTLKAPVVPITGFLVFASIVFWALAAASDWAAFRLSAPGQALVPFIAVLVFVSLLGVEEDRVSTTAVAVVCGVLFLLAHRAATRAVSGVWLDQGSGRGYTSLMAAGGVVAVVAALVGIVGGPAVPGADEAPLVEIGDATREENKPLEVISPLVQIKPRLIDQSDQILFTVEANERAYWRIAALDVFDGTLWRSQGQFRSAGDELSVGYPSDAPVRTIDQTFDLGNLNVVWAPAAYLPTSFENLSGSGVNFEAESATFIVDTKDQPVSDGLVYRVQSQVPTLTPDLLTTLAANSTQTVDPRYLGLPADYSPLARDTALGLTVGLNDPYAQALALQNYFRENFVYDIEVAKGHNIERIEDFLTVQRGYCEQFAGTYASMARAIGLPARVAIGFTPGEPDPDNPNRYIVRGRHAHAWPEVFIPGAGWVAFEPTPGRGAPNATDYTGVPEAQDSLQPETQTAEAAQPQPQPASASDEQSPAPTPTPAPATPEEIALAELAEQAQRAAAESNPLARRLTIIGLIVGAIVLWAVGVPALKRAQDRRRTQRAGDDTRRRVTLAWAATADLLEAHGASPQNAETLAEYADRIHRDWPIPDWSFGELTELAVVASYRSAPPTQQQVERADALAAQIRADLEARQPWPVRSATELDPRPLIRFRDPVVERADRLADGAARTAEPTSV